MTTYPLSQLANAGTELLRKAKIATAAKTTKPAVIAAMVRHVGFERELFATMLQGHVVPIANLPLQIQFAVPVLAVVTFRRHTLATPLPVPKIGMHPTDRPVGMIRVSSAPVVNALTGICNAENRWTETAAPSLPVTVTHAVSAAPAVAMDQETTA